MNPLRHVAICASGASLALASAFALGSSAGCAEQAPGAPKGQVPPPTESVRTPPPPPRASAAPELAASARGHERRRRTASIRGTVKLTGRPPEMRVPRRRRDADLCKNKNVRANVVVANNGRLEGTFVRIANDGVKGPYAAPASHVVVSEIDCAYEPRVQGAIQGQSLEIRNGDPAVRQVHTYRGGESWFTRMLIKGGDPAVDELPSEPGIVRIASDLHPWTRAFVVVTAHPFFAVSRADGAFSIEKIPGGEYTVEAWHPHYGWKTARVKLDDGRTSEVSFTYDGTEAEPPENRDELKDLF